MTLALELVLLIIQISGNEFCYRLSPAILKPAFLGMGEHNVAVPVGGFKQEQGRIVLPGATKDALKAAPKFEYTKK